MAWSRFYLSMAGWIFVEDERLGTTTAGLSNDDAVRQSADLLRSACAPKAIPRPRVEPVRNSPTRRIQRAKPPPRTPSTSDMMALSKNGSSGLALAYASRTMQGGA
jgi:hypothetical protein